MKSVLELYDSLLNLAREYAVPRKAMEWNARAIFERAFALKYLLAAGFFVTMIPVAIALLSAGMGMRETAYLGEDALYETAQQMKVMRLALQQVNDIERKAKLYVLLADPSLRQPYDRESYENVRSSFRETMTDLLQHSEDNRLALLINELLEKERIIHDQITGIDAREMPKLPVEEAFRGLRDAANGLWQEVTGRVNQQADRLHQQAQMLEHQALIRTLALMTFSVGFFVFFMVVLHRSIRRLDQAIRKLGAGRFTDPIEVQGPKDMRLLGDRLEWLRQRLLDLEHGKQQFMENVAREIQLPLNGILEEAGRVGVDAESAPPAFAASCRRLGEYADKLQSVCEELVRYTQINENSVQGERASVDLKEVLSQVVAEQLSRIKEKSLRIKALTQHVPFHGLSDQIKGVFEQLFSNAVKFSPPEGEIRVMLRSSGGSIEFEIEDDGPGIDEDERDQVLKPFYKGKAAVDGNTDGAGLGLAIANEYLVHCQGRLEIVDPRQDRHGARIRVQIPIVNLD